jgi:poly(ADP-ribose) glycohydrolase ARH3
VDDKRSKFIGALVGVAIGDSLGARRKGATGINEEAADLAPRFTDDTAMTIGVCESLVEQKEFDYWHMAGRLIRNYEHEPWRRYGNTVTGVFRLLRHGKMGFGMLDRDVYPDGSLGSGAAVRSAPVGLLYHDDPRMLREIAHHCASITHSHELALEGAVLQACAVALAVLADNGRVIPSEYLGALRMFTKSGPYQEKLKTIIHLIREGADRKTVAEQLGNGAGALSTVPSAIFAFLANRDFKSALLYAVSLGGDAEAVGSMTGAIAGACYGMEGIPSQWRETVENAAQAERLGAALWEVKAGTPHASGAPAENPSGPQEEPSS